MSEPFKFSYTVLFKLQDAFHWNSAVEIEIAANSVGEFRLLSEF